MTDERYRKEVAEIEALDPDNIFLSKLQLLRTPASAVYLNAAWKLVNEKQPKQGVFSKASSPSAASTRQYDETLNKLFREKGHINREMRKMKAQQLMSATTDPERKIIMHELNALQMSWAEVQRQIRVYEATGKLIEKKNTEVISTPEADEDLEALSDLKLSAALNTARACTSRLEKRISDFSKQKAIVLNDPKHPEFSKWKKMEADLKTWRTKKARIESELDKRKNGEKGKTVQ